ncbi:hypothetical protein [Burkholderia sp. AU31280]|uniref:hypothetical protein n=1 Tax=Burkholderia sp. AU31280 TaxID=2015353 RepID=UPI001178434A|nr:hypothetical protein [Burkholderia sp. AU31280]
MKTWIINKKSNRITIEENGDNRRLEIVSRRKIKIRNRDRIIILDSDLNLLRDVFDVISIETADITPLPLEHSRNITPTINEDQEAPQEQYYNYTFHIKKISELPGSTDLDDFRYSLEFIKRTNYPEVHLRLPYRHIPHHDFDALINGHIFWSRTAYFRILNGLPEITISQFNYEESIRDEEKRSKYLEKFNRLVEFVEKIVLTVGHTLLESEKRWNNLKSAVSAGSLEDIHFYSVNDQKSSSAGVQLQYFKELFEILEPQKNQPEEASLFTQLRLKIENEETSASERIFERIFAKS